MSDVEKEVPEKIVQREGREVDFGYGESFKGFTVRVTA